MKKVLSTITALVMVLCLAACGQGNGGNEIPDVFGINYTDAVEVLEDDGYEVKAVETSVAGISEKLLYPLEKVDKGCVFKIDEYVLDNLGNLNKDYDVFYEGDLVSEDKSIVIYYAKEDYVLEKDDASTTADLSTEAPTENTKTEKEEKNTQTIVEKDDTSDDGKLGKDFKTAMDSYENFMNGYVDFMKKYNENPSDLSLLSDYADYMSDYTDFVEDFEKWEDEDLNDAELAYYLDVQTRVTKKLLEITN